MKEELLKTQNEIPSLPGLSDFTYERIFNIYKTDSQYAYNILRTIHIPSDLDKDLYFYVRVTGSASWPQLSFNHYNTIRLWWLICLTNGILNPVINPTPGTIVKLIKRDYLNLIIQQINTQI